MRKWHRSIAAMAVAALLASGCASTDHAHLQGAWIGHEVAREAEKCKLVISGNQVEFRCENPKESYKGTFTLDQKAQPKQLEFSIEECSFPRYVGKTTRAIYKLENTTLTFAATEPGVETRPTAFERSVGVRVFLLTKEEAHK